MARLDPQQRAREYRQRHRDNGWTRNEKQKLRQLERKADRADKKASQPDQTSPMEVVASLPDPTSDYLGRSLVLRTPGGFRSSVNTAIQLADDTIAWSTMVTLVDDGGGGGGPVFAPAPVRVFAGVGSGPAGISARSDGGLWVMDLLGKKLYNTNATGTVLGNIDIPATYGGSSTFSLGGPDVASDNVFWWYHAAQLGVSPTLRVNNADGSTATWFLAGPGVTAPPPGVALNASRTVIFLTNPGGGTVARYSSGSSLLGSFGSGLNFPCGVCLDPAGNVWVSSYNGHVVHKYDGSSFAFLLQIGSTGVAGNAEGQFSNPYGVHVDSANRLFVADKGNNRIQVFDLSGNFIGAFGSPGAGLSQFNGPRDVTVSGTTVSIADYGNSRISQWTA